MNTSAFRSILYSLFAILLLLVSTSISLAQGPLPPTGPPAPTMKTLQQIEPRTDLQATPAPAGVETTQANYHFIINQPGSYYLSANVAVTKTNGIRIEAEGVTLDLNGFQISRTSGTGGNGIEIASTAHSLSILNGSIKGFLHGILNVDGGRLHSCRLSDLRVSGCSSGAISLSGAEGAVLQSCRVDNNSGSWGIMSGIGSSLTNCSASNNSVSWGIWAREGSTLINCAATRNTADQGILAGDGSTLTNCAVSQNTGNYGIRTGEGCALNNCTAFDNLETDAGILAGSGSTLSNCAAERNKSAASSSAGIRTLAGCRITDCTASSTSTSATSTPFTGMGFDVGSGSTIQRCNAYFNEGDGIKIHADNLVLGNNAHNNGKDSSGNGNGAGIHAIEGDNRIEGNNVTNNDRGIEADGSGNFILRNSASGNTTNWDVVEGNIILVVIATTAPAVIGNSGGTPPGSTDPSANFTY